MEAYVIVMGSVDSFKRPMVDSCQEEKATIIKSYVHQYTKGPKKMRLNIIINMRMIPPDKVLNSRPFDNTNLFGLVANLSSSSLMQLQSCCYYIFSSKKLLIMSYVQYVSLCQLRRLEPLSLKFGRWNLFVVICGHHGNREVVPAPSK